MLFYSDHCLIQSMLSHHLYLRYISIAQCTLVHMHQKIQHAYTFRRCLDLTPFTTSGMLSMSPLFPISSHPHMPSPTAAVSTYCHNAMQNSKWTQLSTMPYCSSHMLRSPNAECQLFLQPTPQRQC